MNYYFKPVSPENIIDIHYLIKSVYNVDRDLEEIKKKYNTEFFGLYAVGLIAYSKEDDLPAAYYGVFPCQFTYESKTYLAAQSGDTMTHPNHRKKGLFVTLAKKTYELCKELGIEFVFGFPGEASYYGFVKKLEWQHNEDIVKYSFLSILIPYALIQKIVPTRAYLKIASLLTKPFINKDYPYSNIDSNAPHISRSNNFYNYKEKLNNFNIRFLGLNVWFQVKSLNLIVGDIDISNQSNPKSVIYRLRLLAIYLGLPRVLFHVSQNSNLNNFLEKKYDKEKGLAIGYIDLLATKVPLTKLNFTYSDFDTF